MTGRLEQDLRDVLDDEAQRAPAAAPVVAAVLGSVRRRRTARRGGVPMGVVKPQQRLGWARG